MDGCTILEWDALGDHYLIHRSPTERTSMAPHGTTTGTQQSLPCTEHVLAELGSIYPTVAYWASAEAGEEEAGEEEPTVPGPEEQAEELDEAIFAGIVAMR